MAITRRTMLRATASGVIGGVLLSSTPGTAIGDGGEELWRYNAEADLSRGGATIVDGTAYFTDRNVGTPGGNIYAIDIEDGEEEWKFDMDDLEPSTSSASSPCVVDGTVYSGNGNQAFALDAEEGTVEWESEYGISGSPVVIDDLVYTYDWTESLVFALSTADGSVEWETEIESPSTPVIVGGTIYLAGDETLYGIDADDGSELWTFDHDENVGTPTIADGVIYFSGSESTVALDADDREILWEWESDNGLFGSPGDGLTVLDDTVLLPVGNELLALETEDGEERWRNSVTGNMTLPTVADGLCIIGGHDDIVIAYDADTGDTVWEFETEDSVESHPIVADGTVYIGDMDGYLYAIDAGVGGSSEGSRVMLATSNHHDGWTGEMPASGFRPGEAAEAGGVGEADDSDGFAPGLGVGTALAGLGGAGYLLAQKYATTDAEETVE